MFSDQCQEEEGKREAGSIIFWTKHPAEFKVIKQEKNKKPVEKHLPIPMKEGNTCRTFNHSFFLCVDPPHTNVQHWKTTVKGKDEIFWIYIYI